MRSKQHWEQVYSDKPSDSVSWFQPHAKKSMEIIGQTNASNDASIIDVGGGDSTLVDDLLVSGFSDLTVLDLSGEALKRSQKRIGAKSEGVNWLEADITQANLPQHRYDIWHDRAVFHFLTHKEDRLQYVNTVTKSVKPGGFVIVATFAENGPTHCSGLPIVRYNHEQLHGQFGQGFSLVKRYTESHKTPTGSIQSFIYCLFQMRSGES